MRGRRIGLLDHPADLGDFFHQVQLSGQAASRVGEHHINAACPRRRNGVENDRRRVARFLRNDRDVVAFPPGLQLLTGRGTEGVAGREQHRFALGLEIFGQLADRRGLAGTVNSRDHDDEGLVGSDVERRFEGHKQFEQRVGQRLLDRFGGFQFVAFGARLECIEQVGRRIESDIAREEEGFQVFKQFVVDLTARKEGFEFAAELGSCAR